MKTCYFSIVASILISGVAIAENVQSGGKHQMTSSEAKARMELSMMKRFGGRIRQPNSEKGCVIFVNQQKLVDVSVVDSVIAEWAKKYHVTIKSSETDVNSGQGTIVIRIEDIDRKEPLILAPENFWASINVRSLAKDNPPAAILKNRVEKELKRAYAFVNGGTCGSEPGGLCGTVASLSDLDAIQAKLYTPDVEVRLLNNQASVGVEPYRVVKYIDACQEGWAPAPTNEYQKAIWDQVHQLPSEPIKIKPETKKVTE